MQCERHVAMYRLALNSKLSQATKKVTEQEQKLNITHPIITKKMFRSTATQIGNEVRLFLNASKQIWN